MRLILSYEGTKYFGWQKSKEGPTIEESLETALHTILQKKIALSAASRTDRGVHAEGQVVQFYTDSDFPLEHFPRALNSYLPKDIRVVGVGEVPLEIHPTLDALQKEYLYRIDTGSIQSPFSRLYAWHYPYILDVEKMRHAASQLVGTHDFRGFATSSKGAEERETLRALEALLIQEGSEGKMEIYLKGKSFLYKMARNIVGTLVYIGQGKLPLGSVETIFKEKRREFAGVCAPAHGLTLKRVYYLR